MNGCYSSWAMPISTTWNESGPIPVLALVVMQ